MSITDELREYVGNFYLFRYKDVREKLDAIADRIDAEHERELTMARGESVNKTLEVMGNGYIKLPKDADGVPILIGDELDGYGYPKGGAYCKAIVNDVTILAGPKGSSHKSWLMWDATEVRHHKPTIEDVLREFGDKYCDMVAGSDKERELFAEYAAKLQLRGDVE